MKSLTKPVMLATAACAALVLAACGGGGGGDIALGGSVYNLTKDGLEIVNLDNGDTRTLSATGPGQSANWSFTKMLSRDETFKVEIKSAPPGVTCVVENGQGRTGVYPVFTVAIYCQTETHALGGSVSGLTGTGLVLANGSDQLAISANGAFTMPRQVPDGSAYGIVVLAQPSGQSCTVLNGTGKMGTSAVNDVQVTCS